MLSSARLALFNSARASSSRSISTTSTLYAATAVKQVTRTKKTPFVRIEGPFKTFKPITPGLRHLRMPYNPHLYNGAPIRALTVAKRKTGGRNKAGRITVRSVGGGHKQRIRILDFYRSEPGKCDVIRIEFDPRRSAHIALIRQRNPNAKQIFSYILAPDGIRAGDVVESYRDGIPDGLVEGFVDLRRRVRVERHEPRHNLEKGLHRVDVQHHKGPTATAEVMEPLPVKGTRVPAELEEGSVAQLEAELAALEAAAEQAALEAAALHAAEEVEEGEDVPSQEVVAEDAEADDGLATEAEFLPDPAAPVDGPPEDATFIEGLEEVEQAPRLNPRVDAMMAQKDKPEPPSTSSQLALGILRTVTIKPGNVLPLRLIPSGVHVHNISLHPYGPGKLVRSAGTYAEVVLHEEDGKYSHVKLQSGEVRKIGQECCATIGRVSNEHWKGRQLGKAGRSRNLGIRPHVRGVAMNAVDHPHGGGRGKSKGNKHPRSIYGWLAKGQRTRKPGPRGHPGANRMVVHERPRGVEKRGGGKRK